MRLAALPRRLRRGPRASPGAAVLLYHRVAIPPQDPQWLAVTPEHFAQHLGVLRRAARVIPLPALAQGLEGQLRLDRTVVMTFDDGYADTLHQAKPLLERYDMPATAFIVTGYLGSGREFWWDELERLLLQPGTLPDTLRLQVNGAAYTWHLEGATVYPVEVAARHRRWSVINPNDPGPRQALYRTLHRLLRPLVEEDRHALLERVREWAGADQVVRSTHRTLSAQDIPRLAQGRLIEVGAHTVTHPVLAVLDPQRQRQEIQRSKIELERLVGYSVRAFSYPYGSRADYTKMTRAIVRETGFELAFANWPGTIRSDTDRFQVPRFIVRDWDGEEFSRRLTTWLEGTS